MTFADPTTTNIALWENIFASREWGKYPPEELVRFISRTYPDRSARIHMRVLEVGCGPGANLWYLAREGFAIAGIDCSKSAISTAMERLRHERLIDDSRPPDLKVGNFATLPWGDNLFDGVIDIGALTANTSDVVRSVVSEIKRVLKPGGWFFGKMFGPETTGTKTGKMLEEGTTQNPTEGPLKGMGIIRVFTEAQIRQDFAAFAELRLDWIHRSDKNRSCILFDWLVQARK